MSIAASREWRSPLSALIREEEAFEIQLQGGGSLRLMAFPLNAEGTLMVPSLLCCREQPQTPALSLRGDTFEVRLSALPQEVQLVAFTVTGDALPGHTARLIQGQEAMAFTLTPGEVSGLTVLVSLLLYRKGVWRIRCVGQGFSGGMPALLQHYKAQLPTAPVPQREAPAAPIPQREAPAAPSPISPAPRASAPDASPLLIPVSLLHLLPKLLTVPREVWVYGSRCACLGVIAPGAHPACPPHLGRFPDLVRAMREAAARHPAGAITVWTQGAVGQNLPLHTLLKATSAIRWDFHALGGAGYGILPLLPKRMENVSFRMEKR
ncbi:MAG: TerD family protein [Clostridia bacterium]|nr:TerD family protein [Clostridia bacterium]